MRFFKSKEEKEIEELEIQKKDIDNKISRLKRVPLVVFKDWFERHPNVKIKTVQIGHYPGAIDTWFPINEFFPSFMIQEILGDIGYVISSVGRDKEGDLYLQWEHFSELKRRSQLPDGNM